MALIFFNDDTGFDAAKDVIARAVANLAPGTRAIGGAARAVEAPTQRDLLDDVAAVLGEHTVPAADLPALLAFLSTEGPRRQFFPVYEQRDFFGDSGLFPALQPADD